MVVRAFQTGSTSHEVSRTLDIVAALNNHPQAGITSLEVVGVHADGDDLWIQLCNEDASEAVVLRLRRDATPHDAVTALRTFADTGERFPRVLDVVHRC